jgi:hypothetical protein
MNKELQVENSQREGAKLGSLLRQNHQQLAPGNEPKMCESYTL